MQKDHFKTSQENFKSTQTYHYKHAATIVQTEFKELLLLLF